MDPIKTHLKQEFQQMDNVISLAAIDNPYPYSPLIDGLDLLLLCISTESEVIRRTEHIRINEDRVKIMTVSPEQLEQWIASGENRSIIEWLVRGEILLDRDNYLLQIRERLLEFPVAMREQKQLVEFATFIRTYLRAKQDLSDNNLLDAYSNILSSLQHWAHIALIEAGVHPELTVWRQMRRFNPGIYKLYEELTVSPETLEQRVRLVLLACEFSAMSKMKACCSLLFTILSSREEPWSVMELQMHPLISSLHIELSLLIQKLAIRGYIEEVAVTPEWGGTAALELRYRYVLTK
ncbi:nucleotidyltransferase-like protein [Paenibacillus oenotherae]